MAKISSTETRNPLNIPLSPVKKTHQVGTRPVIHTQIEALTGVAAAAQPSRGKRGSRSLRSHLRGGRSSASGGDASASAAKSWSVAGAGWIGDRLERRQEMSTRREMYAAAARVLVRSFFEANW
jgi:hypothetical protein